MDLVPDIRTMLNDFGVFAKLTDVSASTSIMVKGFFSNESKEVDVGDILISDADILEIKRHAMESLNCSNVLLVIWFENNDS